MILPVFQLILLYYAMGTPEGLKLAVVNNDIDDHAECFNQSSSTFTSIVNGSCNVEKSSCLFVNAIKNNVVEKHFFTSIEDATRNLKHGQVIAVLHIKKDFSRTFNEFLRAKTLQEASFVTANVVEVHIDRTIPSLSGEVEGQLLAGNSLFIRQLLTVCNISASYLDSQLSIKEPIFGNFYFDFRSAVAHSLIAV